MAALRDGIGPLTPTAPGRPTSTFDQTGDKRVIKLLNIVDEYDRRWLASRAARSIDSLEVIATLDGLVADVRIQLGERTEELNAARLANRELLTRLNLERPTN